MFQFTQEYLAERIQHHREFAEGYAMVAKVLNGKQGRIAERNQGRCEGLKMLYHTMSSNLEHHPCDEALARSLEAANDDLIEFTLNHYISELPYFQGRKQAAIEIIKLIAEQL